MAGRGEAGPLSFGCLLTYLFTRGFVMDDAGGMPRAARWLMKTDFMAATLQAVLLLPVVARLAGLYRERSPGLSRTAEVFGLVGFSLVAVCRLAALLTPKVSDILFMGPTGLVGVWLLLVCLSMRRSRTKAPWMLGLFPGACLMGVGLNFVFNGGLAVFTHGPLAYSNDMPFHEGLALTGVPAFTLFPVWSILLGRAWLRAGKAGAIE